jgi:hypothetical protein
MKTILFILFLLTLDFSGFSQEIKFFNQRPKRNLFLSIAGEGGLASINYEKIHLRSFKLMIVSRLGFGFSQDSSFKNPQNYYVSMPGNISFCFGKRRLLFDVGFGATIFLNINKPFYEFCYYPTVGYRFQPLKANKIYLKLFVSFPPNLSSNNFSIVGSEVLFVPIGINIGKSF